MLELFYITNNQYEAKIADNLGVDWIFIDLEKIGKVNRQKDRNTVISNHEIKDIELINTVTNKAKILVRCNPYGEWTENEIAQIGENDYVDMVMLPYFKEVEEVESFLKIANSYSFKVALLLETMSGINNLDEILSLSGIDYVHIGLNDIHIERKTQFMFEPFSDGLVDSVVTKLKKYNQKFGIGGIGCISKEILPSAESLLGEHYRLGSKGVILSRTFKPEFDKTNLLDFEMKLKNSLDLFRNKEQFMKRQNDIYFEENKLKVNNDISSVVKSIINKN